jgi:hypothetical protein
MQPDNPDRQHAEERLNRLFALIMASTVIGGAVAIVIVVTVFRG